MVEPQKHAKWKQTDTKGHLLCVWFHSYEMSNTRKSTDTESSLVATCCWGREETGSECLMGMEFHFGTMKMPGTRQ